MKITKEQFNELNQLDRIEFRQKVELIEEFPEKISWIALLLVITGHQFLGIIFLIATLWTLRKRNKKLRLLEQDYFNIQKVKRYERRKK